MPTQTLQANSYIYFEFHFRRRGVIKFYIEAENLVDTFIVDEAGFHDLELGREFTTYGGFQSREQHQQEIRMPYEGYWYLVIRNPEYNPVAIHHEVYG